MSEKKQRIAETENGKNKQKNSIRGFLDDYMGKQQRSAHNIFDEDNDKTGLTAADTSVEQPAAGELNLKENAKEFEEIVKKYYSQNHDNAVEQKLNELYTLTGSGAREDGGPVDRTPHSDVGTFPRGGQNRLNAMDKEKETKTSLTEMEQSQDREWSAAGVDLSVESGNLDRTQSFDTPFWEDSGVTDMHAKDIGTGANALQEHAAKEREFTLDDLAGLGEQIEQEPAHDRLDTHIDLAFLDDEDEDDQVAGKRSRVRSYEALEIEPEIEFTDPEQAADLTVQLKKETAKAFLSLCASAVVFLLCLYIEVAPVIGLPHMHYLEPGKFGVVFGLISLQMLCVSVMFSLDLFARDMNKVMLTGANASVMAMSVAALCAVHAIASGMFAADQMALFCSIGCFVLFLLQLKHYLNVRSELMAFKVVALKTPKYGTAQIDAASGDGQAFAKYLDDESELFTVKKGAFVSNFFKRTEQESFDNRYTGILLCLAAAAGVLVFLARFFLAKDWYGAFSQGLMVLLTTLPCSMLLSSVLPYFVSQKKAFHLHAALVGQSMPDYYSQASVLSFDDVEVFPPKAVKVTSIKTYGEFRIDHVIITMAKIFHKIGGPLSNVFAKSVQNVNIDGEVQVVETAPDGLRIMTEGKDLLLGTKSFLQIYGVNPPYDTIDESFAQSSGSILYMACDNLLAAKFYIKYAINPQFEEILKALYEAGICVGVKTLDPCINNELILGNLHRDDYPISVLKSRGDIGGQTDETLDSGVVCASSLHNFLKAFLIGEGMRSAVKTNLVIRMIAAILGFAASAFLVFFNPAAALHPLWVVLFQAFWILPVVVTSMVKH